MNKRITTLILTVVMVISLLATAVPVFAAPVDNGVSISKESVSPGDTFQVTLKIPAIPDLMVNCGFKISFDKNVFEVVAPYTPPNVNGQETSLYTTPAEAAKNGYISATYDGVGGENTLDLSGGYTLTATFKVKDGAAAGNYEFEWFERLMASLEEDGVTEVHHNPENPVTKATIEVVAASATVPVTGITVTPPTKTLTTVNETFTVEATVEPSTATNKNVTFSSSNPEVATVNPSTGMVTAVANGTTTITATSAADTTKKATCVVTVNITAAHTHTWKEIAAVDSTCTVQGNNRYWQCTACNKYFKEDKTTETTVEAEKLPLADHNYGDLFPKVPAQCEKAGMEEHYKCSVCNKLFDINKAEATEDSLTIPALTHVPGDWQKDATHHWKDCVVTGCGVIIESTKAAHDFDWVIDAPATEDIAGSKHEECTVCHYAKSTIVVIPKLDHTHTGITKHEAVAATCTNKGNVEYWTCSSPKCAGKYYSESTCTTEITTIETAINPANHAGGTEVRNAVAATCNTPGYTGDTYCLGCNAKIETGTAISATGNHTDANGEWETDADNHWHTCGCGTIIDKAAHKDGEATCVAKKVCSVCGKEYGTVDSANHKHTELRDAKVATEDEEGYTGDTWCTDCNTKIATGTAIPKLDHTHNMTKHDAVAATCCEEGNVEYWTCSSEKCKDINYANESGAQILQTIKTEKDADNHAGGTEIKNAKEATATEKGYTGDKVCKGCGVVLEAGKEIPATGTNKPSSPQTGDNSNMILWITMLFVSGTGVFGATLYGKKKRNRA